MTQVASITQLDPDSPQRLSELDLADLMTSFNEVTAKLADTHETLRSEVARLERELSSTRDQLQRAQQLAALGEMAAGIAHEIRNPLGSIKLYASVLRQDLTDRPESCEVAGKIANAVNHLNAVVCDVLAFARDLKLCTAPTNALTLLNDAVDACADLWAAHNITLHPPSEADETAVVRCDPNLMHQALVNVIRNAAQAVSESHQHETLTPAGGDIWLTVEHRGTLDASGTSRPMIALAVRDSGPGIPPEAIERLFNPFFTTRASGTGLGLAIVHRIMDAHGGRVVLRNHAATSDRNCSRGGLCTGTTVELQLPDTHECTSFQPENQL